MTDRKDRKPQGGARPSTRKPSAEGSSAQKTWGGRFHGATDARMERFSASIEFDQRLWRQDLRGSIAHVGMLAKQGILDRAEAERLVEGLEQVSRELEQGILALDPALEDIHTNIEHRLGEIVGPLAGKLHTGRSRNDQVATDLLLWMRDEIPLLRAALLGLRQVLVERAERESEIILPGYTHLQRAQPIRLSHHWLAHYEALTRDDERLRDARRRMRSAPLGAGALAGSTLPLDREVTARELGFEGPTRNSLDSVAARDACVELLAALAILMTHLSRISEELVLWSSSEFGFVEMADAFATGSSLMPQKKNPDAPELVRGKVGRVVGALVSLLITLKSLPLSYNRDMQEDKEPLFDAVDTTKSSLEILAAVIRSLRVNASAMRAAASDPMLLATDLAEHLVQQGRPFREAHHVVGRVVTHALETGVSLSSLSRDTLREFDPGLDVEPAEFFSPERSLEARTLAGGPGRESVSRALDQARAELEATRAELRAAE